MADILMRAGASDVALFVPDEVAGRARAVFGGVRPLGRAYGDGYNHDEATKLNAHIAASGLAISTRTSNAVLDLACEAHFRRTAYSGAPAAERAVRLFRPDVLVADDSGVYELSAVIAHLSGARLWAFNSCCFACHILACVMPSPVFGRALAEEASNGIRPSGGPPRSMLREWWSSITLPMRAFIDISMESISMRMRFSDGLWARVWFWAVTGIGGGLALHARYRSLVRSWLREADSYLIESTGYTWEAVSADPPPAEREVHFGALAWVFKSMGLGNAIRHLPRRARPPPRWVAAAERYIAETSVLCTDHTRHDEPMSEELVSFLSERSGVVVVSMGTMLMRSPFSRDLLEAVRTIVSGGSPVVVVGERAESYEGCGGEVLAVPWAPQAALLAHRAVQVAVLHGGCGGIGDAMWSSKPMVLVPMMLDQPEHAVMAYAAFGGAVEIVSKHRIVRDLPAAVRRASAACAANCSSGHGFARACGVMREGADVAPVLVSRWLRHPGVRDGSV